MRRQEANFNRIVGVGEPWSRRGATMIKTLIAELDRGGVLVTGGGIFRPADPQ